MAVLVSSVGLGLLLKALVRGHGQRAVILVMTVLATLIAADSPVGGKISPFADSHIVSF